MNLSPDQARTLVEAKALQLYTPLLPCDTSSHIFRPQRAAHTMEDRSHRVDWWRGKWTLSQQGFTFFFFWLKILLYHISVQLVQHVSALTVLAVLSSKVLNKQNKKLSEKDMDLKKLFSCYTFKRASPNLLSPAALKYQVSSCALESRTFLASHRTARWTQCEATASLNVPQRLTQHYSHTSAGIFVWSAPLLPACHLASWASSSHNHLHPQIPQPKIFYATNPYITYHIFCQAAVTRLDKSLK